MTKTSPATAKLAAESESERVRACPGVLNGSFQVTSISLLIAGELLSNCNKTQVKTLTHNTGLPAVQGRPHYGANGENERWWTMFLHK